MSVQVSGNSGMYDNKIADKSVRYGRNAVENNIEYMSKPLVNDNYAIPPILDFSLKPEAADKNIEKMEGFVKANDEYLNSLPPLEYEYRYLPQNLENKIDTKALMGAAYEELGVKEMPVKEFESTYMNSDLMTAEPMDVNKDGKIDLAECGANILAADILSKGSADVSNADGTINPKGYNAVLAYSMKSRAEAAAKLYSNIYNTYKLDSAYKEFTQDENNMIR